jgi:hypothetical protein
MHSVVKRVKSPSGGAEEQDADNRALLFELLLGGGKDDVAHECIQVRVCR